MSVIPRGGARIITPEIVGFQAAVNTWALECFGFEVTRDKQERVCRFTEEAMELAQAGGLSKEEALKLIDYVYGRPVGVLTQEVGGVMTTLATLCNAYGIMIQGAAEDELNRVWDNIENIRAKNASKPRGSPLPGSTQTEERTPLQCVARGCDGCSVCKPTNPQALQMLLWCPSCGDRHIDVGEFAAKLHHTHACQKCGMVWRPAIQHTVGVHFLPGFKDGV